MSNPSVYCIILAGGSGERLWPLSRAHKPKQFLHVIQDKMLLMQTIERVSSFIAREHIWVSTTARYADMTQRAVGMSVGRIIVEPDARNTGPSLIYACLVVQEIDPEAVILCVPADSFIPAHHEGKYSGFLEHALDAAMQDDRIILLGIEPTYPATNYGYIEYAMPLSALAPYAVKKFHEKPSSALAQEYLHAGTMLWNMGVFCARVSVFIEECMHVAPALAAGVHAYIKSVGNYEDIPVQSIDCAVMEKSNRLAVLPVDCVWKDVGTLESFLALQQEMNGSIDASSQSISFDAHNNLVYVPGKRVVLVGVDNVCIVEADGVLLIAARDSAEDLKRVVKQLQDANDPYV